MNDLKDNDYLEEGYVHRFDWGESYKEVSRYVLVIFYFVTYVVGTWVFSLL